MNNIYWISFGILVVGFILFLYFVFRTYKKQKAIEHYEEKRDELTDRKEEPEEVEEESSYSGTSIIARLISAFVVLGVGFTMLPIISNTINETCNAELNVTTTISTMSPCVGATGTVINLVPIFFVIGILSAVVAAGAQFFRGQGLIGV